MGLAKFCAYLLAITIAGWSFTLATQAYCTELASERFLQVKRQSLSGFCVRTTASDSDTGSEGRSILCQEYPSTCFASAPPLVTRDSSRLTRYGHHASLSSTRTSVYACATTYYRGRGRFSRDFRGCTKLVSIVLKHPCKRQKALSRMSSTLQICCMYLLFHLSSLILTYLNKILTKGFARIISVAL